MRLRREHESIRTNPAHACCGQSPPPCAFKQEWRTGLRFQAIVENRSVLSSKSGERVCGHSSPPRAFQPEWRTGLRARLRAFVNATWGPESRPALYHRQGTMHLKSLSCTSEPHTIHTCATARCAGMATIRVPLHFFYQLDTFLPPTQHMISPASACLPTLGSLRVNALMCPRSPTHPFYPHSPHITS